MRHSKAASSHERRSKGTSEKEYGCTSRYLFVDSRDKVPGAVAWQEQLQLVRTSAGLLAIAIS